MDTPLEHTSKRDGIQAHGLLHTSANKLYPVRALLHISAHTRTDTEQTTRDFLNIEGARFGGSFGGLCQARRQGSENMPAQMTYGSRACC